jgi:hypothetical protein
MDKKRLGLWAPILVLAAALVMLAVSTDAADAARGGNGGSSYTVSVSPNPAPYGTSAFVISGSGFKANSVVSVNVSGMLCCGMSYTDSSGSFSYTWNRMLMPDTYSVFVARLRGNSWVPAAMTTFTVTP